LQRLGNVLGLRVHFYTRQLERKAINPSVEAARFTERRSGINARFLRPGLAQSAVRPAAARATSDGSNSTASLRLLWIQYGETCLEPLPPTRLQGRPNRGRERATSPARRCERVRS